MKMVVLILKVVFLCALFNSNMDCGQAQVNGKTFHCFIKNERTADNSFIVAVKTHSTTSHLIRQNYLDLRSERTVNVCEKKCFLQNQKSFLTD